MMRDMRPSSSPRARFFRVSGPLRAAGGLGAAALLAAAVGSAAWADGGGCASKAASADALAGRRLVEVRANTYTDNRQERPSFDVNARGEVFVAWGSRRQERGNFGVFGQRFDALGRPLGTEMHLNAFMPGHQLHPAVAIDDARDVTWVAWESSGQDGHMGGIVARRFGTPSDAAVFGPLGGEFLVNAETFNHQATPALAVNARGEALIVWASASKDGRAIVLGRVFNADGSAKSGEFRLSAFEDGHERIPGVTALSDGRFAVAWARAAGEKSTSSVFARVFNANGQAVSDAICVADGAVAGDLDQIEPSIDSNGANRFAVTWLRANARQSYDVVARAFAADGTPLTNELIVADVADEGWRSGASVAVAPDGRLAVAYNVTGERDPAIESQVSPSRPKAPAAVFARLFDASGAPVGERFQVNAFDADDQCLPVAANARRMAWTSLDQLAFAWQGKVDADEKSGVGLTLLVPNALDVAAPPAVERVPALVDLTRAEYFASAGIGADGQAVETAAFVPPIFDPNKIPEEPEVGVAGVGPDFGFIGFADTGWMPPDPDLAVGPNHVVVAVNGGVKFYTKAGVQTFTDTLNGFFAEVGGNDFVFDPVNLWDIHSNRFIMAATEHDGSGDYICVAVSDDTDPNGTWHKYRFNVDSLGNFVDFPDLGVDDEAIYVTTDYFSSPVGNRIHIFPKAPMLVGDPVQLKSIKTSSDWRSLGAVKTYDVDAPAQYFASAWTGSSTRIAIDAVRNPLGTPTRDTINLTVPTFSDPPSAQQKGTSNRLDTIDTRIKNGVYRNGRLYFAHTIGQSNTARVRWYEIDPRGWPASGDTPVLVDSGTFDLGAGQHNWFGDISVDADGSVAIAMNQSSSADYPFISRAVRRAGDTSGTFRVPVRLQESPAGYNGSRWGDYSGIDEDPVEPGVFWSHHEYCAAANSWRTWIGRFDVNRTIVLAAGPFVAGQPATMTASNCRPGETVAFFYTLRGEGSTFVPQLNVTLGLNRPQLVGTDAADSLGVASVTRNVPGNAPDGATVHVQAAETENLSNVVMTNVTR